MKVQTFPPLRPWRPLREAQNSRLPPPRLTPHASRLTHHASRLTPHASRLTPHASRITHHASRITHHASRITHHASRITHHASRITHHPPPPPSPSAPHPRVDSLLSASSTVLVTSQQKVAGTTDGTDFTDWILRLRALSVASVPSVVKFSCRMNQPCPTPAPLNNASCRHPPPSYNSAMLDIKLLRDQPDFVRARLAARGAGDDAKVAEILPSTTSAATTWPKSSNSKPPATAPPRKSAP